VDPERIGPVREIPNRNGKGKYEYLYEYKYVYPKGFPLPFPSEREEGKERNCSYENIRIAFLTFFPFLTLSTSSSLSTLPPKGE
jgi:hypothetical protein